MKVQALLLAFIVCLEIGTGVSSPPSDAEIEEAFLLARGIGLLQRDLNNVGKEATTAQCPLSMVHGIRTTSEREVDRRVNDAIRATRILLDGDKYRLEDLSETSVREAFTRINGDTCNVFAAPAPAKCDFDNQKYRTADGSCNNKQNPEWGMAGRQQERVLPNAYGDGLGRPRTKGLDGTLLPNPRAISNIVNKNPSVQARFSDDLTLHTMGFGQFLDHDIILTPTAERDCCSDSARNDEDNCFNIIIGRSENEDSEIFKPGYCMQVTRSSPVLCPDETSRTPVRQQKNKATSFIDASNVYGSSQELQNSLRDPDSGKMRTEGRRRPPNGNDADCKLTVQGGTQHCSAAGDPRVNEVPSLTSYHFLFLKEHNRIADIFTEMYPHDSEKVFQETRRIVIAVMQHIVYDEFLPSFFSPKGIEENKLLSGPYKYDTRTNPTTFNGFGIAYRLGHTWISQNMELFNSNFEPVLEEPIEDTFLNPDMTYRRKAFARLQYWLQAAPASETDRILEEGVRSKLFLDEVKQTAFDLAALNIQRGRDHGIPPYSSYMEWCGLGKPNVTWQPVFAGKSGLNYHTQEAIELLRSAGYKSPRDIDLWIGGITESPLPGGSIGPTFECIVGRMFNRLKFGDRYWYQNKDAGFTSAQQDAIRKYSFAKLLCNNFKFKMVNFPNAFKRNDPLTGCDDIADYLDLSVFLPEGAVMPKLPEEEIFDRKLEELIEELEEEGEL